MDDETPTTPEGTEGTPDAPDATADEAFDVANADKDQLKAHAAKLEAQIAELSALPQTIARANEIRDLKIERNEVVGTFNDIVKLGTVDTVDDIKFADEAPVETAPEAATPETAPAAEDTPTAPADGGTTPEGTTPSQEAAVDTPADTPSDAELAGAAEAVLAGAGAGAEAHVASAGDRPMAPAVTRPRVAYTAGAGQQKFVQGVTLDDATVAEAFESRRRDLRPGVDGSRVRAVVANLPTFESMADELPVEILAGTDVQANDRRIREAVDAHAEKRRAELAGKPVAAHVAAICEPLDIIREIPHGGNTTTPFADLFPQRPVGRLGFQFTRASSISVPASGITVWSEEDQDGIDPEDQSTWKPTVLIECSSPVEVRAEELTTSATVDNSTALSSPERVAEFLDKMAVARARIREQRLLTLWDATAMRFTTTGQFGSSEALIRAVLTLLPQLVYPERLDPADYDLVLDPGYLQKLTIDENAKCHREPEEVLAEIRREIGLPVKVLQDFKGANSFTQDFPSAGGNTTLKDLPAVNKVRLVPSTAYIYGATGEESTGWQTDPQLARQNRQQMFSAEWIMLEKHGEHPAAILDITSTADGSRGGCVEPA